MLRAAMGNGARWLISERRNLGQGVVRPREGAA